MGTLFRASNFNTSIQQAQARFSASFVNEQKRQMVSARPWEAANRIVQLHLHDSTPKPFCTSCLIRTSVSVLPCGHSLCESCLRLTLSYDGVQQAAWRFGSQSCSVCGKSLDTCLRVLSEGKASDCSSSGFDTPQWFT